MPFGNEYCIMWPMRNILLGFLMVLMLTPSMACAMPSCAGERQADAARLPCAGHHANHEHQGKHTGKVKLLSDCTGVDMKTTDTTGIDKLVLMEDFSAYTPMADIPVSHVTHMDSKEIRGPPPDWPGLYKIQPSLILTTQRFRI